MIKIHSEIKDEIFGSPKKFFLPTKSFGCQLKSLGYQPKENFDTCPRSEDLIITELCYFPWDPCILIREKKVNTCQKLDVQKVGFQKTGHISVNMSPTDLRQVSKFSLVTSLKLFLWHLKDSVIRKNIYVLWEPKMSWV